MNLIKLIVILIIALFAASASAQFYKYVDEEGNIRFTDDINQVPPEQRAKIQSYVESVSDSDAEENSPQKEESQNPQQQENSANLTDESEQESLEEARKRLVSLKEEIDNEYKELVKEKEKDDAESTETDEEFELIPASLLKAVQVKKFEDRIAVKVNANGAIKKYKSFVLKRLFLYQ